MIPADRPEHYFDSARVVDLSGAPSGISDQSVRTGQGFGACLICHAAGQVTLAADPDHGTACVTHLRDPNATVKAVHRRPDDESGAVLSIPLDSLGWAPGTARKAKTGPARSRPRRYRRRKRRQWDAIPEKIRHRLAKRVRRPNGRFTPRVITADELPRGLRTVLDPIEAMARFEEHPDTAGWRADRWTNWRAVWRALTHRIDWITGGITTTHAQLSAGSGVSVGTVRRLIAWATGKGLLLVVETGASAVVLRTAVNRAPTYAILGPIPAAVDEPVDESAHPPDPLSGSVAVDLSSDRLNGHDQNRPWPNRVVPKTQVDQLRAARTLRSVAGWSDLTDKELRKILDRWFRADWCLAALIHAIDQGPDGHRWPAPPPTVERLQGWRADARKARQSRPQHELQPARRRAAWLCWRLRHWLDDAELPMPPPIRAIDPGERLIRPARAPQPPPPTPAPPRSTTAPSGQAAARAIAAARAKTSTQASARARRDRTERPNP